MSGTVPISFLFRWLRDEIAERTGHYFGDPDDLLGIFVNQPAIALACDHHGGVAHVAGGRTDLFRLKSYCDIRPGATVWLRFDAIAEFVERVLPALPGPIVLVTTDSDFSPNLNFPKETGALLASGNIGHWFCGQADLSGPPAKVTPVPIGIPYLRRNDIFRVNRDEVARGDNPGWRDRVRTIDPAGSSAAVLSLIRRMRPLAERDCLAHGDFWLTDRSRDARFGETRADVRRQIGGNPRVIFPPKPVPQLDLLEAYSRAAFVISPPGGGRDCYRTWEAILMGAIPVMKRSAVDPVYDGFPVAFVEDWSELTEANMARWAAQHAGFWSGGGIDPRLFSTYWIDRIAEEARKIAPDSRRLHGDVRERLAGRMRERLGEARA